MATPRSKNRPYTTSIFKENLIHFAGNSFLEIRPGDAELILVGEYVSDDEASEIMRDPISADISIPVGDTPVVDDFRIAEIDSYRGSYLALTFTGEMSDGNRRVAYDGTVRSTSGSSGNVRSFVKMASGEEILYDPYFSGVNESPLSAYRNAPNLPSVPISSLISNRIASIVGGIPIYSGTIFRGNSAFKRKPAIGISAKFSGFSYGQHKDLLQGVDNTRTYMLDSPNSSKFSPSPVTVRFFSGVSPAIPSFTDSVNITADYTITAPYFDVDPPSGSFDSLIVTL